MNKRFLLIVALFLVAGSSEIYAQVGLAYNLALDINRYTSSIGNTFGHSSFHRRGMARGSSFHRGGGLGFEGGSDHSRRSYSGGYYGGGYTGGGWGANVYMGNFGIGWNGLSSIRKKHLMRSYIGVSSCTMGINMSTHYYSSTWDQKISTTAKLTSGITVMSGEFFPVVYTGPHDAIGLDIALNYGLYQYTIGPLNYGNETLITDNSLVLMYGLPIALVYKSGGEVSLNKHDQAFITAGIGIAPSLIGSKVIGVGITYATRKFAMIEFGGLAGLGWKVRLSYYGGNIQLVNITGDDMLNASHFTSTAYDGLMDINVMGDDDFNISFIIDPFAFMWSRR